MTRQELVDKCTDRIKQIDSFLSEESSEFDFYQELIDWNASDMPSIYKEYDHGDLVLAYFNAISNVYDFETNKKYLSLLMDTANFYDIDEIKELFDSVYKCSKSSFIVKHVEDVDFTEEKGTVFGKLLLRFLKVPDLEVSNDLLKLVKLYIEDQNAFEKTIDFIIALKYYINDDEVIKEDIREQYYDYNLSKKEFNRIYSSTTKNTDAFKTVTGCMREIRSYKSEIIDSDRKKKRKLFKEQQNYKNFIERIDLEFKRDEIKNYEELIKKIHDKELRIEFLKMVYQHNLAKYKEVDETYSNLNENSYLKCVSLLKDNSISKEEVNFSKLMDHSYEMLSLMLKLLKDMNISKKTMIKVLEGSNVDTILYIKELKDNGVLSIDSINNYSDILVSDSVALNKLITNLKIFEEIDINPANLINNPEVLINNDNLETNIGILKDYSLFDSIKSKSNYHYLADSNLIKKIDMFLELGYENYLVEDLSLLNEDNIERLYVLKNIGYFAKDKEELLDILRTTNFIIPDNNLSSYIPDATHYYMDDDTSVSLSGCPCTRRVCDVDGVYLSRNRINRNEEEGLKGLRALIKDSILGAEEIEILKKHSSRTL